MKPKRIISRKANIFICRILIVLALLFVSISVYCLIYSASSKLTLIANILLNLATIMSCRTIIEREADMEELIRDRERIKSKIIET